jgi:hypothetical protein
MSHHVTFALLLASAASAQTETLHSFTAPAAASAGWGENLTRLHDLDGDGVHELAVSARVHGGGPVTTVHSGADGAHLFTLVTPFGAQFYGRGVASIADPAGDGVPDIVLTGARSGASQSTGGWIEVYSGVDGTPLRRFAVPQGMSLYDDPILALDDVDGDGAEDVLCLVQVAGLANFAQLQLFSSANGAPLYTVPAAPPFSVRSAFVALEDRDHDGVRDFAVVVATNPGHAIELRSGATGATLAALHPAAAAWFTANGEPFLAVEDADGDGQRDFAVGGVFLGGLAVFSSADGRTLAEWDCSAQPVPCFGSRIVEAGDLDGDGRADLLALGTSFLSAQHLQLFGVSPASGTVLFQEHLPFLFGGYVPGTRLASFPGADPLGMPSFVLFQEGTQQAVDVRRHAPALGTSVCASTPNSSGVAASIRAFGLDELGANRVALEMIGAPPGHTALFVCAPSAQQVPYGPGFLCVGPASIRRLPAGTVGAGGAFAQRIDVPTAVPVAGRTWTFQGVFRDSNGFGLQSSDAVTIQFQP